MSLFSAGTGVLRSEEHQTSFEGFELYSYVSPGKHSNVGASQMCLEGSSGEEYTFRPTCRVPPQPKLNLDILYSDQITVALSACGTRLDTRQSVIPW